MKSQSEVGLCQKTIDSLRSGRVGFNMNAWWQSIEFPLSPVHEHTLDTEITHECNTVACLAGHIALAAGCTPEGYYGTLCRTIDGIVTEWPSAAASAWAKAYPEGDLERLKDTFDQVGWRPTFDELERILRECSGE